MHTAWRGGFLGSWVGMGSAASHAPPLSPRRCSEGPHALGHTLAHRSASCRLLFYPLLLSYLPDYQVEVAVWFALFLYVK